MTNIKLLSTIKYLAIITAGITLILLGLSRWSRHREAKLQQRLVVEWQNYLQRHPLTPSIFSDISWESSLSPCPWYKNCDTTGTNTILRYFPDDQIITHYNDTMFIKRLNNNYLLMSTTGAISKLTPTDPDTIKSLETIFNTQLDSITLRTSLNYTLQAPLVIIAVRDADNQLIGAIARRVIED